jgi:hypothetical protein
MQQNASLEFGSLSADQEIIRLLWNPKDEYCACNTPPLDPVLSQLNPVHTATLYSFKIHFNNNLPSTLRSP